MFFNRYGRLLGRRAGESLHPKGVSADGLIMTEAGVTATFIVALDIEPTVDVAITLNSDDKQRNVDSMASREIVGTNHARTTASTPARTVREKRLPKPGMRG